MVSNNDRATLGVAVAGFGWMGRVHTQAYTRLLHHYPNLPVAPKLVAVADEVPAALRRPLRSTALPRRFRTGATWQRTLRSKR